MTRKSRLEISVGIFIVAALVILVYFVFLIRDFQIIKRGYNFNIVFGFSSGIKISSPARFAGVDVGEVKDVKVIRDASQKQTKVRVKVWIENDIKIPSDSKVIINTLGLLGEKYIEILPGQDHTKFVKNGDTLDGKDPVSMDEVSDYAKKVVLKLEEALNGFNELLLKVKSGEGSLGKLFYDEGLYNNINDMFGKITRAEGTFGRLISDDSIYKNLQELSYDLKLHPWKLLYKPKDTKK